MIESQRYLNSDCICVYNKMDALLPLYVRHSRLLSLLITAGADINVVDVDNYTALHQAVEQNNITAAELLLDMDINIDAKDITGHTPLHRVLLSYDTDVSESSIMYKINIRMFELLLKHGADIRTVDNEGMSLLHTAADRNWINIIELLIGKLNIDTLDSFGYTPLHFATNKNSVDAIKLLIHNGADVDIVNNDSYTALHYAVDYGDIDTVKLILANSKSVEHLVNTPTSNGVTSLHNAVRYNNVAMVRLLINNGADASLKGVAGKTAFDYATDKEIIELLE